MVIRGIYMSGIKNPDTCRIGRVIRVRDRPAAHNAVNGGQRRQEDFELIQSGNHGYASCPTALLVFLPTSWHR